MRDGQILLRNLIEDLQQGQHLEQNFLEYFWVQVDKPSTIYNEP